MFENKCAPNFILHEFAAIQISQHIKVTMHCEDECAMEI